MQNDGLSILQTVECKDKLGEFLSDFEGEH